MKFKFAAVGFSSVMIVAAMLIVLNLLSIQIFGRLDLTSGKIYSLSQSSKDIVAGLDDRITIKCYFSEDMPAPYNANARYVKDQLAEYRAYSGGNVHYVFIDPIKEDKAQEARSLGIPARPINTIAKDKMEIKNVYMGMVILFEDKKEVLPVVQNTATLEYQITRAIKKLTTASIPKVAFVTGHNELSLETELTYINQILSEEYQLQPLNLKSLMSIPADISTVFLIGPKQPLSDWETYLLDQFLMRGGKLGLLIDMVNADIQTAQAQPIDPGLAPFLRHFGVGINQDLVIDVQNSQIAIQHNQGVFKMQSLKEYPFFPRINNFSKQNLIVKDLENVNMIYASSLDTSGFVVPGLEYDILARTSKTSGANNPPYTIDPFQQWTKQQFLKSHLPMAVAVTGEFTSFYKDKAKPPMDTIIVDNSSIAAVKLDNGAGGRLVVWGDADFVSDQVLRDRSNLIMFQNMTDWLSEDEGLISIRSKEVTARPLKKVDDSTRNIIKFLNIFLMPVIVVIIGVARWQIRKQKSRRILA